MYKSAQSAFYVALLNDFEVSEITRWQNEASAKAVQAETAPATETAPEPVQTAADKPIKTPKKPVSRKNAESVQSETGKWMPAGIGKQVYRCKF